ncbi:MAG TPA: helix-turn-helix transcriptional regulator [Dehalococcoidia bacterium]|nr:helix-turn-helix transcriptional regulator [Dehalococcoidia bacterium]
MRGRGRPKTEGILTPRELEVLELIRTGRSNREIADELDISLAGAKFHVSEIISKLGVTTREEAATWRQEPRARLISPHWGGGSWFWFTPRVLAAAVMTPLVIVGLGLLTIGFRSDHSPSSFRGVAQDSPTSQPQAFEQGFRLIPQHFGSLQAAADEASFKPQMPAYIPDGFTVSSIEYLRWPTNPPGRNDVHNDSITVTYRDSSGHLLLISQGFPAMPGMLYYSGAPATRKSSVSLAGHERFMLQADQLPTPYPPGFDPQGKAFLPELPQGGLLLTWEAGRYGPGWAVSPDRTQTPHGSPFDYGIASDVLPIEELQKIALSVPFITDPSLTP